MENKDSNNKKRRISISALEEILAQKVGPDGLKLTMEIADKIAEVRELIKKGKAGAEILSHISTCIYVLICGLPTERKKEMLTTLIDNLERLDEKTGG